LERLPGVKRADVRLETRGEGRLRRHEADAEKLAAAVDKPGFKASVLGVTEAPKGDGSTGRTEGKR